MDFGLNLIFLLDMKETASYGLNENSLFIGQECRGLMLSAWAGGMVPSDFQVPHLWTSQSEIGPFLNK